MLDLLPVQPSAIRRNFQQSAASAISKTLLLIGGIWEFDFSKHQISCESGNLYIARLLSFLIIFQIPGPVEITQIHH